MRYCLTLVVTEPGDFKIFLLKTVEGNSLIELASKIPLMVAELAEKEKEQLEKKLKERLGVDDDIPF